MHSLSRGVVPFIELGVFGMLKEYNLKVARKYVIKVACRSRGISWTEKLNQEGFLDPLGSTKGRTDEIFTHLDVSTESGRRELQVFTSAWYCTSLFLLT